MTQEVCSGVAYYTEMRDDRRSLMTIALVFGSVVILVMFRNV
jgi:hypothetical protein